MTNRLALIVAYFAIFAGCNNSGDANSPFCSLSGSENWSGEYSGTVTATESGSTATCTAYLTVQMGQGVWSVQYRIENCGNPLRGQANSSWEITKNSDCTLGRITRNGSEISDVTYTFAKKQFDESGLYILYGLAPMMEYGDSLQITPQSAKSQVQFTNSQGFGFTGYAYSGILIKK